MKKEQKQECDANTVYSLLSLHPSLHALCMTVAREGRGVASHSCFCSFFTNHPYIQSKNVLFTIVCIHFSAPYAHAHKHNRAVASSFQVVRLGGARTKCGYNNDIHDQPFRAHPQRC